MEFFRTIGGLKLKHAVQVCSTNFNQIENAQLDKMQGEDAVNEYTQHQLKKKLQSKANPISAAREVRFNQKHFLLHLEKQ